MVKRVVPSGLFARVAPVGHLVEAVLECGIWVSGARATGYWGNWYER